MPTIDAKLITTAGLIAGVLLPLWNIPLVLRIGRRRSSADISLAWAVGVWACILLMLPAALVSSDVVFRIFSILNAVFFTAVVIQVFRYR